MGPTFGILLMMIAVSSATWTETLMVRFGNQSDPDYFIPLPRNLSAAEEENWKNTERPDGPLPSLKMYCPDDLIICVFLDDTGYIAGTQIALPTDKFSNATMDLQIQGFTLWTVETVNGTKTYWTIQQYYVSQDFLETSKEERIASRKNDTILQEGAVWLTGFNGNLTKVGDTLSDAENKGFIEQECYAMQGTHYYYNLSTETECESDKLLPWFLLIVEEKLVGIGFQVFGVFLLEDGEKDWVERPSLEAVEFVVPRAPQCFYDMVASPGAIALHTFLFNPFGIECDE